VFSSPENISYAYTSSQDASVVAQSGREKCHWCLKREEKMCEERVSRGNVRHLYTEHRCIYGYGYIHGFHGWLGSRVVSVLDSGAVGPGFKSQSRKLSGNSLRQTVHTHLVSVHQAAKLVAGLVRVARVTAGLAENNGSLPPGL